MAGFPKIHVVGGGRVQTNRRYKLFVGKKNGEVVCLALSCFDDNTTLAMLLTEVDAEFIGTTCMVDIFEERAISDDCVIAKFWSPKFIYAYHEKILDSFLNDNTEEIWNESLGAIVSFYPYGGPAYAPGEYPNFPK